MLNNEKVDDIQVKGMTDNVTIQQQIQAYRKSNPKLKDMSDKDVASIMIQTGSLKLTPEQQRSLFAPTPAINENDNSTGITGLSVEHVEETSNAINLTRTEQQISNSGSTNITSKEFEFAQQETVIDQFSDDAKAGMELFRLVMDDSGVISRGWDAIKEAFNGNLASDKVHRKIVYVQTTSKLLDKVRNDETITAFDYVHSKMHELQVLLGNVTDEEMEQFEKVFLYEQALNGDDSEIGGSLNEMIRLLVDFEPDENSNVDPLKQYEDMTKMLKDRLSQTYQNFSNTNINGDSIKGNLGPDFQTAVKAQEQKLQGQNLDFKEVFSLERRIEFKSENIDAYCKKEFEVKLRTQVDLQLREYKRILEGAVSRADRNLHRNLREEMSSMKDLADMESNFNEEFEQVVKALGYTTENIENEYIDSKTGLPISFAEFLLNEVNKKIEANLNGKSLDDYNKELEQAYNNAYGTFAKPEELAERFQQSQENAVEITKTVVMVGGIAISLASSGVTAPLIGMGIATLGPTSITALEAGTDKHGITPEEREIIGEELKTSLIFLPVGMGIGSTSAKLGMKAMSSVAQKLENAGSKLTQSLPKFTRMVSEYGSDAVMSTVADMMIMGEATLSGETFNEVMNIFTNAVSRGKMRRAQMKTHAPKTEVRPSKITTSEARMLGQSGDLHTPPGINADDVVPRQLLMDATKKVETAMASQPSAIMKPTEATTFGKEDGITFKPNVNPNDPPSNAYKIAWGKTVEETIELNQKNGVPLELVKDESTGEFFLGIKHSWDNEYYRVDRESIIVKYGEGDFAPVAEDSGAHIFTQTYLDAKTGKPIDVSKMKPGEPLQIIKNPNSTVGAVAFEKPTTVKSLEGDMPNVEMARTDVDGHPYGTYEQLAKDIRRGKLVANESDPNSARFIELVKAGKDAEAQALLKQASLKPATSLSAAPKITENAHVNIPEGKFAAPNSKFAETDEAFRSIVTKRSADIKELDKITDMDEFCRKSFELIKEEMGLEDSGIKINPNNNNDNSYDVSSNTVYFSMNWAGLKKGHVLGQGNKAEIFGGIAHELNHYLQWKEIILNHNGQDTDNNNLMAILASSDNALDNISYVMEHYPDNINIKEMYEKAKLYQDNWKYLGNDENGNARFAYINAFDENGNLKTGVEYNKYKEQPVEKESFRRGIIVAEEYRKVISGTTSEAARKEKCKDS